MPRPILYSFRRCPYAMRARLALSSACITCDLREVVLRDKPAAMLAASPKGTVPVLVAGERIIDESRDIMLWALRQHDPEHWLNMPEAGHALIDRFEGPFKSALDRYKYASRHDGVDPLAERAAAAAHLTGLDAMLAHHPWLFGDRPTLADMATLPFIRQFALTDRAWFDAQPWTHLARWLNTFLASDRFSAIMAKYPQWQAGDPETLFPASFS
ncbi:glutathione S-transferase [Actibacterium sp. D379-3]